MLAKRSRMYSMVLLVILIAAVSGASSQRSGGSYSKQNRRQACSKMVLKNGRVKLRSNGRVVKFACNRNYALVGESTSTCLLGEWTSEPPVCATKGCALTPSPPSGRFIASYGGAVMRLECNPGYRPSGSPMIYCVDRFDWNGTAPLCQASGVQQSATRCDFESDDLCGWVQDARTDEFDWTWQNYGTPSLHLGTGPSFDHTLGQGKAGHYLFIETSSPRILNDTARLFSPVYGPPEASTISDEGVCFTFWFHMYGSTTGRLNVYVKPESKKMAELRPAFVRSGDLGDQWRQGYVSLDRMAENFQVVFEGVRGTGYLGDSAIDDVQLTKGEECLAALKRMMADTFVPGGSTTQPSSAVPPNASCASRCSTTGEQQPTDSNVTSWTCGCTDDCLLKNSCCLDYAAFCLTGGTDTSTAQATTDKDGQKPTVGPTASPSLASTSSTTGTTLATTTWLAPRVVTASTPSGTASSVAVAVQTTPLRPATSTLVTTTSSLRPSPSMTVAASTRAATTTVIASTTARSTAMTTATSTPSSATPTAKSTTMTRSSTTSTSATVEPSTSATTVQETTSDPIATTSTAAVVPSRPFGPSIVPTTGATRRRTTVAATSVSIPTASTSVLVTGDPRQDGLQGDDDQSGLAADDPSPSTVNPIFSSSWVTGAVVAAAICIVLLLTVGVAAGVVRSRRAVETGGVSGRRRRPKLRSSQQDQLAEDSDVRYLRDEDDVQLDLTEATPTPQSTATSQRQFADFERL